MKCEMSVKAYPNRGTLKEVNKEIYGHKGCKIKGVDKCSRLYMGATLLEMKYEIDDPCPEFWQNLSEEYDLYIELHYYWKDISIGICIYDNGRTIKRKEYFRIKNNYKYYKWAFEYGIYDTSYIFESTDQYFTLPMRRKIYKRFFSGDMNYSDIEDSVSDILCVSKSDFKKKLCTVKMK